MNFVYYTRSKQEQTAVFGWLIRRAYIEKNSNLVNQSPIIYDFVCVDVNIKEFGFFNGKFQNPAGVIVLTCQNISVLLKEIKSAEIRKSSTFTYTVSTSSTP